MRKVLKHKAHLHRRDIKGVSTYVVLRNSQQNLKTSDSLQVKGFIDDYAIEGTLQPKRDGSHWLNIKQEWRQAIGKTIGDAVELTLEVQPAMKVIAKK
ncbi:MAG: DUF1905 domain-containing protein [Bacteroidia bacterium]|nr:MAG: hypothetical protein UZ10_BCD003001923 [Bacteroidetes bacterium OLB10]MBE7510859.1 DUF1905 domain-containing protein [Bacteroidia bacterium]MCB0848335.1 DUF1905 domain-containing protein [Bacteroidota bacterium]MCB8931403.1 DUF1905 domain-containing protein [Bacteroidia bacterium]MCW5930157.1 DUF1905 domain-containing protein [Bacteroidota bacterium]